jgi:hypothetical protein
MERKQILTSIADYQQEAIHTASFIQKLLRETQALLRSSENMSKQADAIAAEMGRPPHD